MQWSCVLLLIVYFYHGYCDMYGHTPRCSNNRLDGTGRERTTNNRIFDSQNNARAGYNVGGANDRLLTLTKIYNKARKINRTGVRAEMEENEGPPGKMKYYEGSILHVTWTHQHECGSGTNSNCEIILQYMCSNNLRDGIKDARIPLNQNECHIGEDGKNRNCDEDRRYGLHEDRRYYTTCRNTKRNQGLYTSDQALRGFTSRYTRQNRNGNRNGYECPEERDYYPYWRPSPWIDIAIMTDNVTRCQEYKEQSENVKPRYYCKVPAALMQKLMKQDGEGPEQIPITEEECKNFKYEEEGSQWVQDSRPKYPAPECVLSPKSRDNHHGNGPDGFFTSYQWTIPNTPHKHCAFRMRYNISTLETPWSKVFEIAETPQLKEAEASELRCKWDDNCCTKETPCELGEGDCDRHYDCVGDLICGWDNSPWDPYTDVCRPIQCPEMNVDYTYNDIRRENDVSSWQACLNHCNETLQCHGWTYNTASKRCYLKSDKYKYWRRTYQGSISGPKTCQANDDYKPARCTGKGGCCTEAKPCDFGEGHCSTDNQCKGGLICGRDNCYPRYGRGRDCCTDNPIAPMIGGDAIEAKKRGFIYRGNPKVRPLKLFDGEDNLGKLLNLDLAINTAQYGRTFQDRTHEFSILKRPANLENKKIYNMEVRGKRGNIVQVYPATEYDYSPNRLKVQKDDYLHIQWTGSERNNAGNDGNGRNGYDRNNMILMAEQAFAEGTAGVPISSELKNGDWGRNYPVNLKNGDGKTLFGWSLNDRQKLALSDNLPLLDSSELLSSKETIKTVSSDFTMALEMECGDGEEIRVVSANYGGKCADQEGSLNSECSKCTGIASLEHLKKACDDQHECIAYARSTRFGVNCNKNTGYMQVSYKCLKAEERAYACGKFRRGLGEGGSFFQTRNLKGKDCVEACWKLQFVEGYNTTNGVSLRMDSLNGGCFCMMNMNSRRIDDIQYKSCYLKKNGESSKNFDVSTYRCNGQDNGCCTAETPCDLYEGDCDTDIECKGNLICANNDNCAWGDRDDCCVEPSYLQLDAAKHYFNLEPKQLSTAGEFKYMCSRNNDFSNRSQKGKVKVSENKKKKDNPSKSEESEVQDDMKKIVDSLDDFEDLLFEE